MGLRTAQAVLATALSIVGGCEIGPRIEAWTNDAASCSAKSDENGGTTSSRVDPNAPQCYLGTGALVGVEVKL